VIEADVSIVGWHDPPPWQDIAAEEADRSLGLKFAILQSGMESGRSSVCIAVPWQGAFLIAETSLAMLETVVAAAHGAEERWGTEREAR